MWQRRHLASGNTIAYCNINRPKLIWTGCWVCSSCSCFPIKQPRSRRRKGSAGTLPKSRVGANKRHLSRRQEKQLLGESQCYFSDFSLCKLRVFYLPLPALISFFSPTNVNVRIWAILKSTMLENCENRSRHELCLYGALQCLECVKGVVNESEEKKNVYTI